MMIVTTEISALLNPETLKRFDIPGPRYTSYPTADRFNETYSRDSYLAALHDRQRTNADDPLSLYIHLPFCKSLCFYCACNKIITNRHERGTEYLQYLAREIDLHVTALGKKKVVSQLHLGGGSPTFFSDEELAHLMALLRKSFTLAPEGEYSIEIDPRTVNDQRLRNLSELGFTRISFGVQDFAPEVQQAVHRIQPADQVFSLMHTARLLDFDSVNVDLIYGLPRQTPESFEKTIKQTISLRPDRIALYAYAHLPARFKPQRYIHIEDLPDAQAKISMLNTAITLFLSAGYVYVGMDHFALPSDSLAVAKREGRLHRNFQGYSTLPDCDLIALGVSAIGRVGRTYSQNAKTLEEYYSSLDKNELPITRGYSMSKDDVIRRDVIMAVMCQGRIDFNEIGSRHGIDFNSYFREELEALMPWQQEGLLDMGQNALQVTALGRYFVRAIAMKFDAHLRSDQNHSRFSKIV